MKTISTPFQFADVSPIFKGDDNMNKGIFRAVSILSILPKLDEGILIYQMLDHFFVDLSKGFECLPHPHGLIITKVLVYCCSMAACGLISNYLTNRHQCVMILSNCNTRRPLSKGLSRCSILGPLLFNIFMSDIFLFMENCNFYNFAMIIFYDARRQIWMLFYPILKMGLKQTPLNLNSWLCRQNILNHKNSLLVMISAFSPKQLLKS